MSRRAGDVVDPTGSFEEADLEGLLARVLAGDRDSFRPVVRALEPRVRSILAAVGPDEDFVQDLLQEVFVTAYVKLGRYEPGTDFRAWVASIARNLARGEIRRRAREAERTRRYRSMLECTASRANLEDDRVSHEEMLGRLKECVESLPARQASLIRKVYFEHATPKSVATELGRPQTWLRVTLHRIRKMVLNCVEQAAGA